jgi:CRISPR-associated protein Csm5
MKYGHLQTIKVRLRLLAPLFIGSGESLTKKEYIFDSRKGMIYFPDMPRLVTFFKERGLLEKYERFLSHPQQKDFRVFLDDHKIGPQDYPKFISYSIEAGEAAKSQQFRDVLTFIKDAEGRPYIPGSSLKGALRTAIGAQILQEKGDWSSIRASVEREVDNYRGSRRYLEQDSKRLEQRIFTRLGFKNPANQERSLPGPVNDFMRGIQVSDSRPLGLEQLNLTGKYDRKPDGSFKMLPIFRECLLPGTEAHFVLTLDLPMLSKAGIDLNFIESALHRFSDRYYENYEQAFQDVVGDAALATNEGVDLILGGGAGYASKTFSYSLFTETDRAVLLVSKILSKQFPNHKHHLDARVYKVSPHILKTTYYQGQYYQMGRCELVFEQ